MAGASGTSESSRQARPPVAYRQFVLSFDGSMAIRLGYDAELLGRVCRSFARRVSHSVRHRVKREHRIDTVARLHPGIVTVVQRFRSDLGLYAHLHCLVTDGAFEESDDDEGPQFVGLSAPSDSDLVDVLRQLADDLRGSTDDDVDIDPGIAACVQLALSTPAASTPPAVATRALNVHAFGMNLLAATTVDGRDRATARARQPRHCPPPSVNVADYASKLRKLS